MGHWSVSCGISNIAITNGQPVVLLPLKKSNGGDSYTSHLPATLPIFGDYDDYGGIENIVADASTKLIESHFGVSIEDFCKFLVDGRFTYGRREAEEVEGRMQNLEEAAQWRFMWIHRKVWDFMTTNLGSYTRGHFDFGNPKILELIGFTRDGDTNDTRYTQRWTFGGKSFASDGTWLNAITGNAKHDSGIYNFNRGYSKLSDHITIPEDKLWLGDKAMWQLWEYLDERDAREKLCWIIDRRMGPGSITETWDDEFIESLIQVRRDEGKTEEELEQFRELLNGLNEGRGMRGKEIADAYARDLKSFGAGLCDLVTLRHNMHCMSGDFTPHQLYLTPQDGEHRDHQRLLDAFARINKEMLDERDLQADEDEE